MIEQRRVNSVAMSAYPLLIAIAVPSLLFGRSVFGVVLGLGVLAMAISHPWRDVRGQFLRQAKTPTGILVLLVFAAWLPNLLVSDFPLQSAFAVARTLAFAGLAAFIAIGLASNPPMEATLLVTFVVSALVGAGIALFSIFVTPELYWFLHLKGWVADPIGSKLKNFSALAVFIVPLALLAGFRLRGGWRLAGALVFFGFVALVWENYNRSAMAGMVAAMVAFGVALLAGTGSKKRAIAVLGAVLLAAGALLAWLHLTRGIVPPEQAQGHDWLLPLWLIDFQRQIIWSTTWEFATRSPWFGIGANTVNLVDGADKLIAGTFGLQVVPGHPHNWALEVFAETGAIGFLALVAVILYMAYDALIRYRRTHSAPMLAAVAVMAGYWGSGLFNYSYWSAWWQVAFMLSLAICYALERIDAAER